MTKDPQYHGKAKRIVIKHHFIHVCEQVSDGTVLQYCPTGELVADMFTNGLSHKQFYKRIDTLNIRR